LEHYRRWSYKKPENFTEPEDHLANELDFLAHQIRNAAWALEKGDEGDCQLRLAAAEEFIQDHLNRWVPEASQALIKATQNPFYLGIAYFTFGFLNRISAEFKTGSQGS